MNKIEKAIYDIKAEITRMQKVKIATEARLEAYLETLEKLQYVKQNNHFPHEEINNNQTKEQ